MILNRIGHVKIWFPLCSTKTKSKCDPLEYM
jgi:hypothetical protein